MRSRRDDVSSSDRELTETIADLDRALPEGRLEEFSAFFADDAQFLIHNQETVFGKEAIRAAFGQFVRQFDILAYEPRYEIIDAHGDRAYVLASFEEVLRPRDGGPGIRVHGRVVYFWRRETDGNWRIVMALTARSAPEEREG